MSTTNEGTTPTATEAKKAEEGENEQPIGDGGIGSNEGKGDDGVAVINHDNDQLMLDAQRHDNGEKKKPAATNSRSSVSIPAAARKRPPPPPLRKRNRPPSPPPPAADKIRMKGEDDDEEKKLQRKGKLMEDKAGPGDETTITQENSYEGRRIAKWFEDNELYFGTVIGTDEDAEKDGEILYEIQYDDGQKEDMYITELTASLDLYEQHKHDDFIAKDNEDEDDAIQEDKTNKEESDIIFEIDNDDDDESEDVFHQEKEEGENKKKRRSKSKLKEKVTAEEMKEEADDEDGDDNDDGESMAIPRVGQRVAMRFKTPVDGLYFGIIDRIVENKDENDGTTTQTYHVMFDDKDGKNFELAELEPLMELYQQYKKKDPVLLLKAKKKKEKKKVSTTATKLLRCDICNKPAKHSGDPSMLHCSSCYVAVHKDCYGTQTYDNYFEWKCWPCRSLNQRIPASDYTTGNGIGDLIQTSPPTHCELCGFDHSSSNNNDDDDDKHSSNVVHAFHPIYDNYGPNARQSAVPYKDPTDGTTKYRLAWGHSLCGYMLGKSFLYACTVLGETHEGVVKDRLDDRPPNPHLRDIQEDEIDLNVNGKYGVDAPVHHFVFHTKVKGIGMSTSTRERIEKIELQQTIYSCSICQPSNRQEKDSDASMWEDSDDEEVEWEEDDNNNNKKLPANDKKTASAGNNDLGSLRIALTCNAGDKDEYSDFDPTHNLKNEEPCYKSMHVGCARWGKYSFENNAAHSSAKFPKRVKFHPGFPNAATEDLKNPIRCIYCNHHAKNVTNENVEKARKRAEQEKEKWKKQNENKKKRKAEALQPKTVKRSKAANTQNFSQNEMSLKPKTIKETVINIRKNVIMHLKRLDNRIIEPDSVSEIFRERKHHFKGLYKKEDFKQIWKQVREQVGDWLIRERDKIGGK